VVESVTAHYGWTKPEITKSASTWGGFLNSDLDSIDALVFANQQGTVPIGSITMFCGATAPANWLICDGSSLSTTGTYAALFAVLGYAHGGSGPNFNLPNLQGVFPLGTGPSNALGSTGGSNSITIATANLPPHAHPISDVAHSHGIAQTPHSHGDPGHTHGISDPGHAHTIPQGSFPAGVNFQAGSGFTPAAGAVTGGSGTGISIQVAGTGIQAGYANINGNTTNVSGTNLSTTQAVGSGAALTVPPPKYVTLSFIVRYQ
jgi:microcystin-dependent protein